MRSAIVDRPLAPTALVAEVSAPDCGAVVLFVGTVRDTNDGRAVTGIEYSSYRTMAERELATIVDESATRFHGARVVAEHRVGMLGLGEASVAIAVAHGHRGAAYEASRYVIEEIKRRLPIWKREHYADGTREWVHARSGTARTPEPVA
ncbi:MAG: molybdenum cofactor biosynthesis protein MoaE [Gemmatimonadaceae bacterium]|nr:molybdenum cofactor biosynthesis protein MoaE [Gemmatimonadaceae bacterium]